MKIEMEDGGEQADPSGTLEGHVTIFFVTPARSNVNTSSEKGLVYSDH